MRPPAIGYLRKDISSTRQAWDEEQIRSLAKQLGYRLLKTVTFSERTDRPLHRLLNVIRTVSAEAVFVPSLIHLGGEVPNAVLQQTALIVVVPQATYARVPSPTPAGAR